jgi:HEAT repeat protein
LPGLLPLVDHNDPVVRGDVSNLMGIIGDKEAVPFLEKLLADEDLDVRLISREAIEEIKQT